MRHSTFLLFLALGFFALNIQTVHGQNDSSRTTPSSEKTVEIETAVVFSIDDIEVPAMVKGFVIQMRAEEGTSIEKDQVIGQLDTGNVEMELNAAKIRMNNATMQADDNTPIAYAKAQLAVSEKEYEREKGLMGGRATSAQEIQRKKLAVTQARLQLERSEAQKRIDQGSVELARQEVAAVEQLLDRHTIRAPFRGEIIKISNRVGEYVQEGETVVRLVDSSKVKVEGLVSSSKFNEYDLRGKPVTVTLKLAGDEQRQFQGKIVSIGLEHQFGSDGSSFVVQAVVDNQRFGGQWLLHPKASVAMDIHLDQ